MHQLVNEHSKTEALFIHSSIHSTHQLINEHSEAEAVYFLRISFLAVESNNLRGHESVSPGVAFCARRQRGAGNTVIRQFD